MFLLASVMPSATHAVSQQKLIRGGIREPALLKVRRHWATFREILLGNHKRGPVLLGVKVAFRLHPYVLVMHKFDSCSGL